MRDEPGLGLAPAVVESLYETLRRLRGQGLALLLAEQAAELTQDAGVQRIYLGLKTPAA